MISKLRKELRGIADPKRAEVSKRFFKTGKGEYGEGDIFIGLSVPQRRKLAKKYRDLKLTDVLKLLRSKIHEERNIALLILVHNFERGLDHLREKIFNFYLSNTKYINNWDLVDLSAPNIVGAFLVSTHSLNDSSEPSGNTSIAYKNKSEMPAEEFPRYGSKGTMKSSPRGESRPIFVLVKLARSKNIWERRIAVMATYAFIKNNKFFETLKIAEMLLNDKHDLIHKAVGWMLREVGKRDLKAEIEFLNKHCRKMPRTMLRYAIEKFSQDQRNHWLHC